MEQGFLEREAKRAYRKNRKLYCILLLVFVSLIGFIGFMVKDSMDLSDLSDYRTKKILVYLAILAGFMLVSMVLGLFLSGRAAADASKSLLLPFKDKTREAVAEIIDREIAEGKVQVDEYIETFPEGKTPRGGRIILIPSYLLRINDMGQILVIPREKIYWVCAQVGRKGYSSFLVRLLIFTEAKTSFYMDGDDVKHVNEIVDKLYQYIPNVFSEYDPFVLSYELEKLFDKNRAGFIKFYESEKMKQQI